MLVWKDDRTDDADRSGCWTEKKMTEKKCCESVAEGERTNRQGYGKRKYSETKEDEEPSGLAHNF